MEEESEKEENIYEDEHREEMLENDEISSEEEGFMNGYEKDDEEVV